ncbi:MAG: hypothetical protein AB7G11_10610 [Phycisphaerales bacterium]
MLLLLAALIVFRSIGGTDIVAGTKKRSAIDSATSKMYEIRIIEGDRFPWINPETGERTLYPVEACYWTRDNRATLKPTYVFVKAYAGINEKTVCPDCGREVRQHNPMPPDELMTEAVEASHGK